MKIRERIGTRFGMTAIIIAIISVAAFAAVVASIPDSAGVIHACYGRLTGNVRIVESASHCTGLEQPISWNQAGPQGPQGPAGPQGLPGPAASRYFAHVSAFGQLGVGNAVSVSHPATGEYIIDWGTDLSGCVATVTPGFAFPETLPNQVGVNTIARVRGTPTGAQVNLTYIDLEQNIAFDSGFNIVMAC